MKRQLALLLAAASFATIALADAPGMKYDIRVQDLPKPYATPAMDNSAETVARPMSAYGVQLALQHGATTVEGAAPIELLEVQTGTPLSRADIAGFRSELDATACPQAELVT